MIKHYRLLKDLPTFSAGDIFQLREDGCLYFERQSGETKHPELSIRHWKTEVMAYHEQTLAKFPNILKDWFEALDEPEERFYIDARGGIVNTFTKPSDYCTVERRKIGNDFGTIEEAREALKKLIFWNKLKKKGFEIQGWEFIPGRSGVFLHGNAVEDTVEELDTLFGGDDEES